MGWQSFPQLSRAKHKHIQLELDIERQKVPHDFFTNVDIINSKLFVIVQIMEHHEAIIHTGCICRLYVFKISDMPRGGNKEMLNHDSYHDVEVK